MTSLCDAIPALRPDVRREARADTPERPLLLVDDALGQRLRLDGLGTRVAEALDGPQSLAEFVTRLAAAAPQETAPTAAQVQEVVDGLKRLFLLDEPGAARALADQRRMEGWQHGPLDDVPLLLLPEARFECTCCGGCCGGHSIAPVDDHVIERLSAPEGKSWLRELGLSAGQVYFRVSTDEDGKEKQIRTFRTSNGWCLFLDARNFCRIHSRFGAAAKPAPCRLFPLSFVMRPEGLAVAFQMECRDVLAATRRGEPLAERRPELEGLLGLPESVIARARPAVRLDGLATLPYEAYAALRDELLADTPAPPDDPLGHLAGVWETLERRGRTLAEGPGQERATVDSVAELRGLLHGTVQELGQRLMKLRRELASEEERRVVRLTSLDRVLGGLSRLVPDLPLVLQAPTDPEARRLYWLLARNALHGEEVAAASSLRKGVAMLTLRWVLARAIAVDRAHDVKRREPTAQDHVDGLVSASFALRNQRFGAVVSGAEEALEALFVDHLGALREHAAELAVPDRRTELFLF